MTYSNNDNGFYNFSSPDLTNFSNDSVGTDRAMDSNELVKSNDPEELKNRIEAQEEHELIRLEDKQGIMILTEGKAFCSQFSRCNTTLPMTTTESTATITYGSNDNIFVISFLGDTASGKSFLANHLPGVRSFVFDECEHQGSTTANVTCFESSTILYTEQKINCLVLDFEGEHGSWFPRILRSLADHIFSSETAKRRRDAVALHFPKLAYLLSNVIILMGQDDIFSNSRYVERAKKFALQAVGAVQQNVYKPVLILVQNKYMGKKLLLPIDATEKFYKSNPDAKDLNLFFSAVRCIVLPFKPAKPTPDFNEMFDAQVLVLRKLLTAIYNQNQTHLLPHLPWLLLTRCLLKKVSRGETIMMHMLLEDVLVKKKGNDEDHIILFLFRRLYGKTNIHSTRWFHYCRDFSMNVLARSTAHRLPQYQGERIEKIIETECKARLKELWKLVDVYRPCEALYMGRGYVKEKNRLVFCYQHKFVHDSMHQTSEVVHGASWWKALVEQFIEWPAIDKWNGTFESSDATSDSPGDDVYAQFLQMINHYWDEFKRNPRGIYTTFKRLLKRWNVDIEFEQFAYMNTCSCCFESLTNNPQAERVPRSAVCSKCHEELQKCQQDTNVENAQEPASFNENECVICMSSSREVAFVPCGHYHLCQPCAKKISDRFKICPLCKQVVQNIQKIH